MNLRRSHPVIFRELEATGLSYTVENGGRHYKMRLEGQFVGILPHSAASESYGQNWAVKNCVAQIKRVAKQIKEGKVSCLRA